MRVLWRVLSGLRGTLRVVFEPYLVMRVVRRNNRHAQRVDLFDQLARRDNYYSARSLPRTRAQCGGV